MTGIFFVALFQFQVEKKNTKALSALRITLR